MDKSKTSVPLPKLKSESKFISTSSSSPSEIIQEVIETYSVTKLGMWHFSIAELPRKTFSSQRLTV